MTEEQLKTCGDYLDQGYRVVPTIGTFGGPVVMSNGKRYVKIFSSGNVVTVHDENEETNV